MTLRQLPAWALVVAAAATTLAGCPVPLVPRYVSESRHNVGERMPDFIVAGTTTRDDVLLRLGEPDGRGPGDRWFAYGSSYSEGGVIFIMAAGGGAGGAGVEAIRYRRIVVRFDDQGVVGSANFVERLCPSYMLAAGSSESKSEPCVDVATDEAAETVALMEPAVPMGEQVLAAFAQVRWLGEFGRSADPLNLPASGALTLTDRSLVFEGRPAPAGGSAKIIRIPYSEVMQVSVSGAVVAIELSRLATLAFEVDQAGSFKQSSPDKPGAMKSSGTPAEAVAAIIREQSANR
jgi:outer membrane protein assembly factor BamE (lipoprotein component of BamABCDE complex)